MPAPETVNKAHDQRPSLGHVNLMVDTLIANLNADDLRAIVRNLLSNGTPGFASAFTAAARSRCRQCNNAKFLSANISYFTRTSDSQEASPTPQLHEALIRARTLYGAGMGFSSLSILAAVVRATVGLRWEEESDLVDTLAEIDADLGQAIQSSKEEKEGGRLANFDTARQALEELREVLRESQADVEAWGGEFPFERASFGIDFVTL